MSENRIGALAGDKVDAAAPGPDGHPFPGQLAKGADAVVAQPAPFLREVPEIPASGLPDIQASFHGPGPEAALPVFEDGIDGSRGEGTVVLGIVP